MILNAKMKHWNYHPTGDLSRLFRVDGVTAEVSLRGMPRQKNPTELHYPDTAQAEAALVWVITQPNIASSAHTSPLLGTLPLVAGERLGEVVQRIDVAWPPPAWALALNEDEGT